MPCAIYVLVAAVLFGPASALGSSGESPDLRLRPRIASVSPDSVTGAVTDQWLTINGSGFAEGFTVRLQTEGVDARITDRSSLRFVSSREVRVKANFGTEAASWTVRVANPGGATSGAHRFPVVAPVPRIEVARPAERTQGGHGFILTVYGSTITRYSVIRWDGEDLPTRPRKLNDQSGALTYGLTAKVPARFLAEPGRHKVRVFTPPPGGGLSAPETVFVNPRPFYRTPWIWLLFVAGVALCGYGLYRWRLKNLREEELTQKVDERTRQLREQKNKIEQQAERLRELDEAKSRFFAGVSYEFRTPLTLIRGPLRDLADRPSGALDDEAREQIALAVRNAERLEHLIDQLLDLSRLEAGQVELQPRRGDLAAFARETTRAFTGWAERKSIALECCGATGRLEAEFDPDKLRTVLGNLLSNALKFTPEGGTVVVTVARAGAEEAVLRVEDDGPGLSEEDLPHIFDRFRQVGDPATREEGGVGIGLALAKEFAELHGGDIRVESTPGEGAAFTVTMPLRMANTDAKETVETWRAASDDVEDRGGNKEGNAATQQRAASDARSEGDAPRPNAPTLLIVEDDAEMRRYLRTHLAEDYRIEHAGNGAEALAAVRNERPGLVVSDVMMPEMSGDELCQRLKADDDLGDLPIILLTAKAGEDERIHGIECGADAYVEKPFSMSELKARIAHLIEGREDLRERFSREIVMQPEGVSVTPEEEAFYEQARGVVEAHIGESDFTVGQFANEMAVSRSTLRRKLKAATDRTPGRFVREMRLARAAQMLEQDEALTVAEVAHAVGYRSADHFARIFRERFGASPSEYEGENG
jgi:signal transduction histidine kinase/DNA-binding response OmpR family regulator